MAGAGTIGVGGIGSGVGVGGWQLYEQVINPTLDRQLSKDGYTWQPARVPLSETVPTDNQNKFTFKNWDCVKKLFPGVEIKNEESNQSTSQPSHVTEIDDLTIFPATNPPAKKKIYLTKPTEVTDNFVTCALFDFRGDYDGTKNKIYFKSEVVVKDRDYGWVMWTGLSNTPNNSSASVTLEYRLLTFKKKNDGSGFEVDRGFGWSSPGANAASHQTPKDQLVVKIPAGQWRFTKQHVGDGYSTRRVWFGIAKADKTSKQHLLESLDIHMENSQSRGNEYDTDFFGRADGKWADNNKGYGKANKTYDSTAGWKTMNSELQLGDSLTEWYKPFTGFKNDKYTDDANVRWMTCDSWSGERRSPESMSGADKEILNLCYSKSTS